MAEQNLPASYIDPAIARSSQIERAVTHVARAVELELSGIELDPELLTDETRIQLHSLGTVLVRLSAVTLQTADSISQALGEGQFSSVVVPSTTVSPNGKVSRPEVPEKTEPVASAKSSIDPKFKEPTLAPAQPNITDEPESIVEDRTQDSSLIEQTETKETPATTEPQPRTSRLERDISASPTPTTQPRTRARREQETKYENELYQRIVEGSTIPDLNLPEGRSAIELEILSDHTIKVDGKEFSLKGSDLYMFNAMMRLRDKVRTAVEIRELGYRDGDTDKTTVMAFTRELPAFIERFNALTAAKGLDLIKKMGKTRDVTYAVNPTIIVQDIRTELPATDGDDVKKN